MLRASYSTGFLPPDVSQLAENAPSDVLAAQFGAVTDPRRGNELLSGTIHVQGGGNAELEPEASKSRSAGVVFTPRFLDGLRLSMDWTKIRKKDNISAVASIQSAFLLEQFVPDLITRAPVTPENDPHNYGVGPVTGFDTRLRNLASALSESYDFSVNYVISLQALGRLSLSTAATRLVHNEQQVTVIAPTIENAGTQASPSWNANAVIGWDKGSWSAIWTSRYWGRYWLSSTHAPDAFHGSARVPSIMFHDVSIGYRFGRSDGLAGVLNDSEVQLGVKNVFNTAPRFIGSSSAYYDTLNDPVGAAYSLSIRKAF
jgi:hypothetical protein